MKNGTFVITGGSGFIGTHLIMKLLNSDQIEKIINMDLKPSNISDTRLVFQEVDIREQLPVDQNIPEDSYLIHLAALCKEPGYHWDEYFETNYHGTKNLCDFAETKKIKNIIYISTMMVYRAGERRYAENDLKSPDTAYGISKLLGEEVLLQWAEKSNDRTLKIIRPGVVFGKGENGNYIRLYNALKRNTFAYVGRKSTIKGSIYVKDLVGCIEFLFNDMSENKIYNLVYPESTSIENIVNSILKIFHWKRIVPTIPYSLLLTLSYLFEFLNFIGVRNGIHHRRIQKLFYSTDINSDLVYSAGYHYHYNLENAIQDWKNDCSSRGLF
jgi:nucleoside-diphosphate-sugar epimerase